MISKSTFSFTNNDDNDKQKLSEDNSRKIFGDFIYDFFSSSISSNATGTQQLTLNLICDACGGSNSVLSKCTKQNYGNDIYDNADNKLIVYSVGIYTKFDSAVYIEKLYNTFKVDKDGRPRNKKDNHIHTLHLQHWSHPKNNVDPSTPPGYLFQIFAVKILLVSIV